MKTLYDDTGFGITGLSKEQFLLLHRSVAVAVTDKKDHISANTMRNKPVDILNSELILLEDLSTKLTILLEDKKDVLY